MKLTRIYFDAYKSILFEKLDINYDCMGFVGTNESGKSNVLAAINILSEDKKLSSSDTPKMADSNDPALRFLFTLNDAEKKEIKNNINEWIKNNALINGAVVSDITVTYHVKYNRALNIEERYFTINNIKKLKDRDDILILLHGKLNENYKIKNSDTFVPLDKARIIRSVDIDNTNNTFSVTQAINDLNNKIEEVQNHISERTQTLKEIIDNNSNDTQEADSITPEMKFMQQERKLKERLISADIAKSQKSLDTLLVNRSSLQAKIKDFDLYSLIDETKKSITEVTDELQRLEAEIQANAVQLSVFTAIGDLTEDQINDRNKLTSQIEDLTAKFKNAEKIKLDNEEKLKVYEEPLSSKYTNDINELNKHIDHVIQPYFKNLLPKVVFWEHNQKYILQSSTKFSEILSKSDLNDIARPLVNIFRIGLEINNLDSLKSKIIEIQNKPNERTRLQEKINRKINKYIGSVWGDYDQHIKISLEQEQIRIEIYDPKTEDASYYNMEERSQGCQTFLSFLLTIGAEADHGVIKNTILLLDEPETHLHPSGVRFMLKELIKISEKDNLVIYATHSIFLIDRDNFDRHVILVKKNERTNIKPSSIGRIGFFMQEEVLYNTLDLNLNSDLSSDKKYNFVFEGDGDTVLFEHFYDKILKDDEKPINIDKVSFYQGGKCSNIKKYFKERPIQLGTKWIFILDNDKPADELKNFIQQKYSSYIGSDIYVFQYHTQNEKELEDLLTTQFIESSYIKAFAELNYAVDVKDLRKHISSSDNFNSYNNKIVNKYFDESKKEAFKAKFKDVLNGYIKEAVTTNGEIEVFKKTFPEYFTWANGVISQIKKEK